MRVGEHLINVEAIQQVTLKEDDSAVLTLIGPRKGLQQIRVPKPQGRELWTFVHENLAVVEFGELLLNAEAPQPRKDHKSTKKANKDKKSSKNRKTPSGS